MLGAAIMAGALPAAGAEPDAAQRTLLVPRDALFASPAYSELQISPDGRQLAFLHPLNGVLNVWVAPLDDPKAATPVTRFDTRPPDSRSEEHTSELQSLMRISYAVSCLKKKIYTPHIYSSKTK